MTRTPSRLLAIVLAGIVACLLLACAKDEPSSVQTDTTTDSVDNTTDGQLLDIGAEQGDSETDDQDESGTDADDLGIGDGSVEDSVVSEVAEESDQGSLPITHEFSIKTYTYESLIPYLPVFAEYDLILYLGVSAASIGNEHLTQVLTDANTLGVPITLCPNASVGGFPHEENYEVFAEETDDILDWVETVTTAVEAISINLELPSSIAHQFQEAWADDDIERVMGLAEECLDREMFLESVANYQSLVTSLQERGYEVQVTTYPFLLDDHEDGDTDLQDMCSIPMDGVSWDLVAPCAYSTEYAHLFGTFTASPYFVYMYGKVARERFGDGAVVAVGLVRNDGRPGYATPEELGADIAAAKAAGVRRIEIFSFRGMLQYDDYDFEDWIEQINVEPAVPERVGDIDEARDYARFVDSILDNME